MNCCGGGTQRVKKFYIKSQYKQQQSQIKEDDTIRTPIADRKLFQCQFNLAQIINPKHMLVAAVDYTHINSTKKDLINTLSSFMVRQQPQQQMRDNQVRFQSQINEIIRSKGEIVKSDSNKSQVDEKDVELKVIDFYDRNDNKNQKVKPLKMQQETMIA